MELILPVFVRPKDKSEDEVTLNECTIKPMVFFIIENAEGIEEDDRKITIFDSGSSSFKCNLPIDIFITKYKEAVKQDILFQQQILNNEL